MKKIVLILVLCAVVAGITIVPVSIASASAHESKCASYYLVDFDTGTVLAEGNADVRRPIASMVKIMTLLISFDEIEAGKLSLDDEIVISPTAAGMGGSQMFLDAGQKYKVSDLIKGIVVSSANDAAAAMAERISGGITPFVNKMNAYAKELGMNDTLFSNTTGLPGGEQYSTAKDVTLMTRKLLRHEAYFTFSKIWMENFTHPSGRVTEMVNTNKLIRFNPLCDGGKTGFTNDAMFCLSATAKSEGMRVVATVLGSPDSQTRFNEITELFNYAFANFENKVLMRKDETIAGKIEVKKAKEVNFKLYVDKDIRFFCKKGEEIAYKIDVRINENLAAPIKKNSIVGNLRVIDASGQILSQANIRTDSEIPKSTYFDALEKALGNWLLKNKR